LCHDDLSHIEEVGVFLHRYYLMNFSFLNCG
jgi:hypothetical protein